MKSTINIGNYNGSLQRQRFPDVLSKNYIRVDERELYDVLLALGEYAKNINFYDLDEKINGNWYDLLMSDEAIFLASTISINIREIKKNIAVEMSKGQAQGVLEIWKHIQWLNCWLKNAVNLKNEEGRALYVKISNMIQVNLLSGVADLYNLSQHEEISDQLNIDDLEAVWNIHNELLNCDTLNTYCNCESREKRLGAIFNAIANVISFLARESEKAFNINLKKQSHQPASALLLAFLQAYKRTQKTTNCFSQRLLEYYYLQVQRNPQLTGGGDRVYLECQLSTTSEPVIIEKGVQFIAGKTENLQDILYEVQADALITGAQLGALKTLFIQRHLLISPENITRSVTRIKVSDVLDHLNNNDTSMPHSLFGYDDGASGFSIGSDRDTGLVISSGLLRLKQGHRRINLNFSISDRHLEIMLADNEIKNNITNIVEKMQDNAQQVEIDVELSMLSGLYLDNFTSFLSAGEDIMQLENDIFCEFQSVEQDVWLSDAQSKVLKILYKKAITILLLKSGNTESFVNLYHQVFCKYIFKLCLLSDEEKNKIIEKAASLTNSLTGDLAEGVDDSPKNSIMSEENFRKQALCRITEELNMTAKSLLQRYFSNAFIISLSAENGWYNISRYALSHIEGSDGFEIALDIKQNIPAISDYDEAVHGEKHQQGAPVLIIRINAAADIYPYSYFEPLIINRVKLHVDVKGFKDIVVQNDNGLVDRSKPFQPFGPAPDKGASFYIGGYEYAQKNIKKINLNITWKNLPTNYGGMSEYYASYDENITNADFNVRLSLSSSGSWLPVNESQQQCTGLFSYRKDSEILLRRKRIDVDISGQYPVLKKQLEENEFINLNDAHNGYIKLSLLSADMVFGHKIYPQIMGKILTLNAKNKKQLDFPPLPYTPEIEFLSVDYTAEEIININLSRRKSVHCAQSASEQNNASANSTDIHALNNTEHRASLYYITPLGIESLQEKVASNGMSFFPQWQDDGNLYIGFTKEHTTDRLNIYIQLRDDATHPVGKNINPVRGTYYSAKGWKPLDKRRILSDTTGSLRHSGIITLKLPQDMSCHPDISPQNHYWINISSTYNLSHYSSILSLGFDALSLHSVNDASKLSASSKGISSSWRALTEIPGVKVYTQSQLAFDSKDAEKKPQSMVRCYERLRHKNRAITPWDYERLVLEAFAQLHLVKCFPATKFKQLAPAPGHVLMVVAPRVQSDAGLYTNGHLVNAAVVQNIADFLKALMPTAVKLDVRNPVYEKIQLRCAVTFSSKHNPGQLLRQFNRVISDYLSPWSESGDAAQFNWSIHIKDIESILLDLPYVEDISRLSLIKVIRVEDKPKKYALGDSAKLDNSTQRPQEVVTSEFPWSLPLPFIQHHIEVINEEFIKKREPQSVGINSLRIGNTFVIQPKQSEPQQRQPEGAKRDAIT